MVSFNLPTASLHNAAMLTGGWVLVAAGILSIPLPGPFSTPAITLGGLMLARRSSTFRHLVAGLRAQFPESSAWVTIRSRRWPRAMRYVVLRTDPRRVY